MDDLLELLRLLLLFLLDSSGIGNEEFLEVSDEDFESILIGNLLVNFRHLRITTLT